MSFWDWITVFGGGCVTGWHLRAATLHASRRRPGENRGTQ